MYTLLAVIATAVNIGFQDVFVRLHDGIYSVPLSMVVGTGAGLLTKYILDKKFIFHYQVRDAKQDVNTFLLYALMGLTTTAIFWFLEAAFAIVFGTKEMRYVGAVVGLAIGYFVKYRLDRRFVFVES
jgi:putative flippase GtrA